MYAMKQVFLAHASRPTRHLILYVVVLHMIRTKNLI